MWVANKTRPHNILNATLPQRHIRTRSRGPICLFASHVLMCVLGTSCQAFVFGVVLVLSWKPLLGWGLPAKIPTDL